VVPLTPKDGLPLGVEDEQVEAVQTRDVHKQVQNYVPPDQLPPVLGLTVGFGISGWFRFGHRLHRHPRSENKSLLIRLDKTESNVVLILDFDWNSSRMQKMGIFHQQRRDNNKQ
jgi:hypothetical protein